MGLEGAVLSNFTYEAQMEETAKKTTRVGRKGFQCLCAALRVCLRNALKDQLGRNVCNLEALLQEAFIGNSTFISRGCWIRRIQYVCLVDEVRLRRYPPSTLLASAITLTWVPCDGVSEPFRIFPTCSVTLCCENRLLLATSPEKKKRSARTNRWERWGLTLSTEFPSLHASLNKVSAVRASRKAQSFILSRHSCKIMS